MAQQIIRSIGSDGLEVLSNILDKDTGKLIEFKEVSEYYDGTPMSDGKLDAERYLYIKNNGKYYLRVLDNPDKFLEKDTMLDMRNISNTEILLLKMGYYKGITLNGYYEKGDTPNSINYKITNSILTDDSYSIIKIEDITLIHDFNGRVNVLYAGLIPNDDTVDNSPFLQNIINGSIGSFKNGIIYIPKGLYYIKSEINIPSPVELTIEGDYSKNTGGNTGFSGLLYNGDDSSRYVINVVGEADSSKRAKLNLKYLFIRNITGHSVDGVVYNYAVGITLDKITISGFKNNLTIYGYFYYNTIKDCSFIRGLENGIFATSICLFNGTEIRGCRLSTNANWGFYSEDRLGELISFCNNWIENNGIGGIRLIGALASNIVGNYFENNGNYDIELNTRSTYGGSNQNLTSNINSNKFRPLINGFTIRLIADEGRFINATIFNNIIENNSLDIGTTATFLQIPLTPNRISVFMSNNKIASSDSEFGNTILSSRTSISILLNFTSINDDIVNYTIPESRGSYSKTNTIDGRLAIVPGIQDVDSATSSFDIVFPGKIESNIRTRIGIGSTTNGSHTTEFYDGGIEKVRVNHKTAAIYLASVRGMPGSSSGVYFNIGTPEGEVIANINSICLTPTGIYRKNSGALSTGWVLFQPSAASIDTANDVGDTYSKSEVQAILTELRDLKTKMRTSGLLRT